MPTSVKGTGKRTESQMAGGERREGATFHPKGTFLGPAPVLLEAGPGPDAWNGMKRKRKTEGLGQEAGKAATHR